MNKHFQLATLFLAAGLAAVAQSPSQPIYRQGGQWVQEIKGALPAGKLVRVKTFAGGIMVQGAKQNNVTYTIREHVYAGSEEAARREFNRLKFTTFGSGETVLRAECEGSNRGYIDFDVQVPSQVLLVKLETEGGGVTAKNISGKLEVSTGGGNIQLDQIGGMVAAESGGGNIEIGKAGSDVNVDTGGGHIHIESAAGRIIAKSGGGNLKIGTGKTMNLETGGGWIRVLKCDGPIKAGTGGGSIELNEVWGRAQLESGGGGIKVGPVSGGIRAETGSGPIVATLARGGMPFTDSRLETSVGDIIVYVPDGLGVTVRADVDVARGEGIHSDFPELKVTSSTGVGPREAYAEGSLYGGGPLLHVHTSTGNIVIRRKGKE
ncbi:MAG TPA: hypothetical protein VKB84_08595 [Candidatus Binataceae bacterium]|nr:hypothetical protein [Candidatus Binataceae bacterium]